MGVLLSFWGIFFICWAARFVFIGGAVKKVIGDPERHQRQGTHEGSIEMGSCCSTGEFGWCR